MKTDPTLDETVLRIYFRHEDFCFPGSTMFCDRQTGAFFTAAEVIGIEDNSSACEEGSKIG